MRTAVSFQTINRSNSGPGAFLRGAKWYWDEVTEMTAAAGFRAIALPIKPNSPTDVRNGAPICTDELREVYGSVEGYRSYLQEKGIERVSAMLLSAQDMLAYMQENSLPMEEYFSIFYSYAEDACTVLKSLGGEALVLSPTPAWGALHQMLETEAHIQAFLDGAAECLNRIGRMSAALGIRTCVKNDFWTLVRGTAISSFLEKLDDAVFFAPDTAQLQIAGADPVALIRKHAGRIGCVCLTDTKYRDETENYKSASPEFPQSGRQQRCYHDLGYGDVDFPAVYAALREAGFDGLVILESRYTLEVPRALLRMRTFWNRLTKAER